MKKTRLFLHIEDAQLLQQLINAPAMQNFYIYQTDADAQWPNFLLEHPCDVSVIQSSNQDFYQSLIPKLSLFNTHFIFITDGVPTPAIDSILKVKACHHFRQPIDMASILATLTELSIQLKTQHDTPKLSRSDLEQFGLLAGSSDVMRKLYSTLKKVAITEVAILIEGESGTGKELAAHTIHLASNRASSPFVAINCGALSPELVDSELFGHIKGAFTGALKDHIGVFAQADGGTLFLDEITEMPIAQQVKLLRVLESGEYRPIGCDATRTSNVRVIAATNRCAKEAINTGVLREDLYFRLAQFPLKIPNLRDRKSDILGLAQHFLAYKNIQSQQRKTLSASAKEAIEQYSWPGNVRELKHTIERAFILADKHIQAEHLMLSRLDNAVSLSASTQTITLDELEKEAILKMLEITKGCKSSAALQLGISVKTLYNKLEKYQQL